MPKNLPQECLVDLRRKLDNFPSRSSERRSLIEEASKNYGVSTATLYRLLQRQFTPKPVKRSDSGNPRILPKEDLIQYCEIIAAIRIRTSNKKGRHLSTQGAINLLEEFGIDTSNGFVKSPPGALKKPTVNRYLKLWGLDFSHLNKQPPAVRFQADHSNDCWHFDLSPSDLKKVEKPIWVKEGRGHPTLMLYSIVDDRSGVAYQEYRCVYGEDVEAGLRFLFNAMSAKNSDDIQIQGIPKMIYTDNGPISKSSLFKQVMKYLEIELKTHVPRGKDGNRVTARSKGKVERPFRTVKDMYETLYHFHKPQNEAEANQWLMHYLKTKYNTMSHRSEPHSRVDDWVKSQPQSGIRAMCSWERFCTFARKPENRKVGIDGTVSANGIKYQLDGELSGEEVVLWWGLLDEELFVEHLGDRFGPYQPVGGPIPLHKYRSHKTTSFEKKRQRIGKIAEEISLPKEALTGGLKIDISPEKNVKVKPFKDPDPFHEINFPSRIAAKEAISDILGLPLANLKKDELEKIDAILFDTLDKKVVMKKVKTLFSDGDEKVC